MAIVISRQRLSKIETYFLMIRGSIRQKEIKSNSKVPTVFINKACIGKAMILDSHAHLRTDCLWLLSCKDGRAE